MAVRNRPRPEPRWRRFSRWLGGPDSWRRIAFTGITAGVTLAFVAALITGLIGGGGGSLDGDEPTVVPGGGGPVDPGLVDTVEEPALDTPTPEAPIEEPPTEVPTEAPVEPPPTEVPVEPTPTLPEKPPPEPTLSDGGA